MAIYHLEAKVVSRWTGRSAVAASAYMSCSAILNDYDGIQHDYTRKRGLVWEQVFLPDCAPREWKDRSVLWNAVEEAEKAKDSRLVREFVPALPVELTPEQWKELLSDFIQTCFVAEGMCADMAIHDEGLLEKNANEKKSGAGQYFTPRVLIDVMTRLMKPQAGELCNDPACGTFGFMIAAHQYVKDRTDDFYDLDADTAKFEREKSIYRL